MSSFSSEKVVIVGGSSGLGLAVAAHAYGRGAEVVIASRSASARHAELAAAVGPDVQTLSLDVTSCQSMEAAFRRVGQMDHLVITTRPEIVPTPFAEIDCEQAKQAFETKFWGQYLLIQTGLSTIRQGGSIIMTTGIAGERVFKGHSTMGVINGATEALCRALAVELAPIRVNAVSPGFVAPKPKEVEDHAGRFPAGRLASVDEVAEAYVSLMENRYVTGVSLVVDGGARLV